MYLKQISYCLLLLLLLSCSHHSNLPQPTPPNAFQLALARYYRDYSEKTTTHYHWKIFKNKADKLERGNHIPPGAIVRRGLPNSFVVDLSRARLILTSLLSKPHDTIQTNPKEMAACQFYFDCWLEQQKQNGLANDIDYCRSSFYKSIKTLIFRIDAEKEFINYTNDLHSIYFKFGSDKIEGASILAIKKLVSELRKVKTDIHVVLYGYTDRVGKKEFNNNLSQRRISAVKSILLSSGAVSNEGITTKGFGEQDELINIDTEINNPHSRRVDVFLYKK